MTATFVILILSALLAVSMTFNAALYDSLRATRRDCYDATRRAVEYRARIRGRDT